MADGTIEIDTRINSAGAEQGIRGLGGKLGGIAKTGLKVFTGALTVASGAVTGLAKMAVSGYAEYEQLVGGVETLFKKSSSEVINYANNAYKTAGMSANEYMKTITGFSASLLQGLGGDTKKAAEIGNMAVTDMADNANKMGTAIGDIQNAYQGFAKQNYTMLDNLKLGYGGTKEEMQRLLKDAEKISGIKYNLSNFGDIINAIHVVQTQMGITGTTAKEAASTIEGSLNMTKSAWSNLLTGMADDNANFDTLVNNLVDSVSAFAGNILPRLKIALNGIGELISRLAKKIPDIIQSVLPDILQVGVNVLGSLSKSILDTLPILIPLGVNVVKLLVEGITNSLPEIVNGALSIINALVNGIVEVLPTLLQMGIDIIVQLALGIAQQLPTLIPLAIQCILTLVTTLFNNLPLIVQAGLQLLQGLVTGIINAIPILVAMLPQVIQSIINFVIQALPMLLNSGLTILLALINGIVQCIPQLIAMLPTIINTIINFITQNLPQIIQMGIKVLLALINGLVQCIPQLIAMLPTIINTIVITLLQHLPEIMVAGIQILVALAGGLIRAIPRLIGAIPQIVSAIFKAFADVKWLDIGINIVKGVWEGILSMGSWIGNKVSGFFKGVLQGAKDANKIKSPSRLYRDEVGKYMAQGIGVGFEDEFENIKSQMAKNLSTITGKMQATVGMETAKFNMGISARNNKNTGSSNEITNNNDNGLTLNIENFVNNTKQDIKTISQELEFYRKKNSLIGGV